MKILKPLKQLILINQAVKAVIQAWSNLTSTTVLYAKSEVFKFNKELDQFEPTTFLSEGNRSTEF